MIRLVEESSHSLDAIEQRQGKGFELQRNLQPQRRGVVGQSAAILDARPPLLGGWYHLAVPDVLTEHEEQILRLEFVDQVEVGFRTLDVKPLHARIEIDQTHRHAADRDDRKLLPPTFMANQPPLANVDVERVGEDVDRVEADFLRLADAPARFASRLGPRRINQSQLHDSRHLRLTTAARRSHPRKPSRILNASASAWVE